MLISHEKYCLGDVVKTRVPELRYVEVVVIGNSGF